VSLYSIGISRDGYVVLFDSAEYPPPKYTSLEHALHNNKDIHDACDKCDIFGLGVVLWSIADYLNDENEEPQISEDLCDCINQMTHDQPHPRPSASTLIEMTQSYENAYKTLLQHMFLEVDRKSEMRQQYEKGIISHQRNVIRKLLEEIKVAKIEQLKHTPQPAAQRPVKRGPKPHKPVQPIDVSKSTKVKNWEPMSVSQRIQMFNK